jgi:hypothetical protein
VLAEASLTLKRLGDLPRQNGLPLALREIEPEDPGVRRSAKHSGSAGARRGLGDHVAAARRHRPADRQRARCVKARHRSSEFIGFLEQLNGAYPSDTKIKLSLNSH